MRAADAFLKKNKVQDGHFDGVISQYREVQVPLERFEPNLASTLQEIVHRTMPRGVKILPVHILDLLPEGSIASHIDHIEYSGEYIVGLSLNSHAVMTLQHKNLDAAFDLLLPRRSLYVLQGAARFEWEHSIARHPTFDGEQLAPKGRRVSVIFRDLLVT